MASNLSGMVLAEHRVVRALLLAAFVGTTVMVLSNAAIYVLDLVWSEELFTGWWGRFNGSFSALVAFGVALGVGSRRSEGYKVGWVIAAIALGIVGLLTTWWILAWDLPPLTLEGAWIYPLAIGSLLLAAGATGRVSARAGWVIATLILGFFGALLLWWAFFDGFPPASSGGWLLYALAAAGWSGAIFTGRRVVGSFQDRTN